MNALSRARWTVSISTAICLGTGEARAAVSDPGPDQGLVLRLDAAEPYSVKVGAGGTVSSWEDLSGGERSARQQRLESRPRYRPAQGRKPAAVVFDGVDDLLTFDSLALRDLSLFVVFTPGGSASILLGDAANRNWLRVGPDRIKAKWDGIPSVVPCAPLEAGATVLLGVVRKGTLLRFSLNGETLAEIHKAEVFTPAHIGHKSSGGATENFLAGSVHEIRIYDRPLATVEFARIEDHLRARWGVKPAGHASAPGEPGPAGSGISHGPMLGAVSETTAAIWLRTVIPAEVRATLTDERGKSRIRTARSGPEHDNTVVFRFDDLVPDTRYTYAVSAEGPSVEAAFRTFGPSLRSRAIRLVFGYGYNPRQRMKGASIFTRMADRHPDFVLFIGDFPYTTQGKRAEIRQQNKVIRDNEGFAPLTRGTPTCAVWDDHDFGPNDCDGTHPYAEEALAAFKEYWANPAYGETGNKGIYSSFVIGNVEVFLLDGRYSARQDESNPTMLGPRQYRWLCDGLLGSTARYKLLVSGTPFSRVKDDCWGGRFYRRERDRLFEFISGHGISGVIAISGDIHRCDIHKLPMGNGRFLFDFTAGALARVHRYPPKKDWPEEMLYSYGNSERNMFGELEFHPESDARTAITFRAFSGRNGLVHRFRVRPEDLGLTSPAKH